MHISQCHRIAAAFAGGGPPRLGAIATGIHVAPAPAVVFRCIDKEPTAIRAGTFTHAQLLGRMNASYRSITYGVIPIGALLGGALGQAFGLRAALVIGASGLTLSWLWLAFSPSMRMRRIVSGQGYI